MASLSTANSLVAVVVRRLVPLEADTDLRATAVVFKDDTEGRL